MNLRAGVPAAATLLLPTSPSLASWQLHLQQFTTTTLGRSDPEKRDPASLLRAEMATFRQTAQREFICRIILHSRREAWQLPLFFSFRDPIQNGGGRHHFPWPVRVKGPGHHVAGRVDDFLSKPLRVAFSLKRAREANTSATTGRGIIQGIRNIPSIRAGHLICVPPPLANTLHQIKSEETKPPRFEGTVCGSAMSRIWSVPV